MIRLDIDLHVEQAAPDGGPPMRFSVRAEVQEVVVTLESTPGLGGMSRRDLTQLVPLADGLARRGIRVRVEGPKGTLVQLGDVKSGPVGRAIAGSPHIKLGHLSALLSEAQHRERGSGFRLPLPPSTLFPLVPTVARRVPRRVTTTHYLPGSGRPRLIFAVGSGDWNFSRPREFDLLPGRTVIGSGPDADLRLEGLEARHAEVRHNDDDEYVLYSYAATGGGRPNLPHSTENARILRTGSRIEIGPWRLAYYREEFADHGRPFGGRQGGEYEFQKQQPVRPYGSGELG
ncbi:FHA domain-containing protein [Microbacterium sp. WCS2018Hpa-9]|uniref:FHA domain-containing protein n=1 Tax=Microbacterium sp. WCS2018Hpa-9 TaxID=3073635 RepID=UPI00288A1B68|nr:FHA domain-containing protein [Microbacterium sp. WCS2018Hpa-9]